MVPQETVQVPWTSDADVSAAVQRARDAFEGKWGAVSPATRRDHLWRIATVIDEHVDALALLEARQTGKPLHEARGEVKEAAEVFRHYSGWADKVQDAVHDLSGPGSPHREGRVVAVPKGVVAAITAFNYPILLAAWKLAPALAAGNTVVIKPAETTPLTIQSLAAAVSQSHRDLRDVIQVVTGGARVGRTLVAHPAVEHVSFTGSTAAGEAMARAHPLKTMTLELGGKNAMYVDRSADLELAVATAVDAGWTNAGQNCCAASRIIVHEEVHDAFVERLVKALGKRIGIAPKSMYNVANCMGPLAHIQQAERVRDLLAQHAAGLTQAYPPTPTDPSRPLTDASIPPALAAQWVPPTLYTGVAVDHALAQTELFGPVVCVLRPVRSVNEAVAAANATPFGLASGIVAADEPAIREYTRRVRAGMMWVNTWNLTPARVPFGGWGASGRGRELGGMAGMAEYLNIKTIIREE
ncbi:hypothetical protein H9P43_003308 [Blastocladiella emersonii ATCC 22665]|nr:hypothetical protein H9P43_003308 [Blastocladiella emersonii ATCC 22665]